MPFDGKQSDRSTGIAPSTRRKFLAGTAGVAATGLAGCSGGGDTGGDGGSTTGSSSGGTDTADSISVAAVEGSGTLFKKLANSYVEDDTGISVDVSLFPYANLFSKTQSVISSQSDAYDLIFMDDPWFPQFAGDLEPIENWIEVPKDEIIQNCLDIATWPAPEGPVVSSAKGMDQKLRGQVVVGNTQLFAYNTKYYEQAGVKEPATWDDVYEAGRYVEDNIDGAHGYIIRGKRGNPINANFFSLGNSKIGDMFDGSWNYNWDSSDGVDALDFYVNDLKSISPEGVASFNSDAVLNHLGSGEVAQSPAWPAAASLLLDPDKSDAANDIAFTPIPKGKRRAPEQGNWIAGINKYTSDPKKKATAKVIQSFISKEAQDKYVDLGGVPFRHDTFEDNMDAQPWFPALYESLQTAKWRPRTPLWNKIAVTQGTNLNSALTGSISPQKALSDTQKSVHQTLSQAGYYE
ncbi:MAG: extracellular solute-binding protein [Halanaeroarchaeum sp.]